MFCKKCGKEQTAGQKFCPVCGEPYLDENGKPYLKGFKKDIQDAKEKVSDRIDEISQKSIGFGAKAKERSKVFAEEGQKTIKEKVVPKLNKAIEEVRNLRQRPKKLTFYIIVIIGIIFVLRLIFVNGSEGSSQSSSIFSVFSSSKEVKIELSFEGERQVDEKRNYVTDVVTSVSSNYGGGSNDRAVFTDCILVPNGKMWIFKNYTTKINTSEGFHAQLYYFRGKNLNNRRVYYFPNDERDIPIFREGDIIQIVVPRWVANVPVKGEFEVTFVEKDNEY